MVYEAANFIARMVVVMLGILALIMFWAGINYVEEIVIATLVT